MEPSTGGITLDKAEARVCILRVGGTNCDRETKRALEQEGVKAEVVHLSRLLKEKRLDDYHGLVIPGGFAYGDYVRAGAILGKQIASNLGSGLASFIEKGKPVLGICNGFQALVEAGLLPGFRRHVGVPEAALATNSSARFECRWVHLKHENRGRCIFTTRLARSAVIRLPVAHSEGRFVFAKEREEELFELLLDNDQLVFRYCSEGGAAAEGIYPLNPNGSLRDIAGISDPSGTVLGMMPHPERACAYWQLPDWTSVKGRGLAADGRLIFESMVDYILAKL
ncbi:MAG: phosphoribosylformylglycinamidine synthase I [Candidatus Bathyarchaeia archaeon]